MEAVTGLASTVSQSSAQTSQFVTGHVTELYKLHSNSQTLLSQSLQQHSREVSAALEKHNVSMVAAVDGLKALIDKDIRSVRDTLEGGIRAVKDKLDNNEKSIVRLNTILSVLGAGMGAVVTVAKGFGLFSA